MMFGSTVGFWESADPMVKYFDLKMQDGSWRPWIYKNGHNFTHTLQIDNIWFSGMANVI